MLKLKIVEAKTKRQMKTFIKLPWRLYKDNPHWVAPLLFEQKHITFNPKKHPFFEFGEAAFFLIYEGSECIGRISAHINHKHNEYHNVNEGFFGFFECTDNQEAATLLLETAEAWVKEKGASLIRGPENYTIYDEVGILVEGWENEPKTPVLMHLYNPPYYQKLLENAGYNKDIDWYAFLVTDDTPIKPVFKKIKTRLEQKGFVFRCIDPGNLDAEVDKLKDFVNQSWSDNWGHVPYTDAQFEHIKDALKLFLDPRFILMVEYEGELVGASISLPDVNPSLKKAGGHLFPFGWWHLLRAKKKATGLRTFLFGVLPDYRNRGIDVVLVTETIASGRQYGFSWSDCSLIVETNNKIIEPIVKWNGKRYRTFRIFKKDL